MDREMKDKNIWHSWLLVLAVTLIIRSAGSIFLPSISYMADDLKVDQAEATTNLSLYYLFLTLSFVFFGPVCDRFSKHMLLRYSLVGCIVGCLLCAFAWDIHILNMGRSIQALSAGLVLLTSQVWIGGNSDKKNMLGRLAWFSIIVALSPIIAPVVGGILSDWLSWRYDFILIVLLSVPVFVLTYRVRLREPERTEDERKALSFGGVLRNYKEVLFRSPLESFSFSVQGLFWAQSAFAALSSFLFVREFGVSATMLGIFNVVFVGGLLLGRFPTMYLQKRHTVRFTFLFNQAIVLLSSVGVLIYYFCVGTHELAEVVVFTFIQAIGFSGLNILSLRNSMLLGGEYSKGTISGFYNFMNQGISWLGVLFVQLLFSWDLSSVFIYQVMAYVCLGMTLIGTFLFLRAYPKNRDILE